MRLVRKPKAAPAAPTAAADPSPPSTERVSALQDRVHTMRRLNHAEDTAEKALRSVEELSDRVGQEAPAAAPPRNLKCRVTGHDGRGRMASFEIHVGDLTFKGEVTDRFRDGRCKEFELEATTKGEDD